MEVFFADFEPADDGAEVVENFDEFFFEDELADESPAFLLEFLHLALSLGVRVFEGVDEVIRFYAGSAFLSLCDDLVKMGELLGGGEESVPLGVPLLCAFGLRV